MDADLSQCTVARMFMWSLFLEPKMIFYIGPIGYVGKLRYLKSIKSIGNIQSAALIRVIAISVRVRSFHSVVTLQKVAVNSGIK